MAASIEHFKKYIYPPSLPPLYPSVSVSKKRKNRPRRKGEAVNTGATKRKMSPVGDSEAVSLLDSPRGEKLRKSCHPFSPQNSDPALNECKFNQSKFHL